MSDTSLCFRTLSTDALISGRSHDRSLLSPTELTIAAHYDSHGRHVQILTGEHLSLNLCVEHIHHLLMSYSEMQMAGSYSGGLEVSKSLTTLSCLLGRCTVTVSCKRELSALIQVSARQVQLQARFDSISSSLDFSIASLGVSDLSTLSHGPHRTRVTMLIRDRGDAGETGPNFSLAVVFGLKREMTIVFSRLYFALLPCRINEIITEFQTIKTTRLNSSAQGSKACLSFRITCNQSQFIYSPELLTTNLGMAIGL